MSDTGDFCVGDLEVRVREHVVLVDGSEVRLSSREFEIVRMLAEHPGWVFSAGQLAGEPEEGDYSPESVSVLVSRLRGKLATAGARDVVETVRGAGYRLHASRVTCDGSSATGDVSRELKDALWQVQEAVIEVGHSGNAEQQHAATEALERARRAVFGSLAE